MFAYTIKTSYDCLFESPDYILHYTQLARSLDLIIILVQFRSKRFLKVSLHGLFNTILCDLGSHLLIFFLGYASKNYAQQTDSRATKHS
jgi:hypothetical protein